MLNMLENLSEIGSEFWFEDITSEVVVNNDNGCYVLSGRTAIDVILQDIQKERKVQDVYLPAYCCDSMLQPFMDRGIKIHLYDMWLGDKLEYDVDENKHVDILYICNYFGYENNVSNEIIERFREFGAIIIYDKTHSMFMDNDLTVLFADYSFASIRKWMGVVAGAVIWKRNGFISSPLKDCLYLQCKIEAMQEKRMYLSGNAEINKQVFLDKYAAFGHSLSVDYRDYRMDKLSCAIWEQSDKERIKQKRKKNAIALHSNRNVQYLNDLSANSCPIFVPVFFESSEVRNRVRKSLIDSQVYCPIHWPKNKLITTDMKVNDIFDRELSLICDQRYNPNHMDRINEIIKSFFK